MDNNRVEKKFVFGKYNEDIIEKNLLINGFNKLYPPRKIDSIYIDTENFDFAKDNINGVSKRKKIRFRWYNDDIRNIFLEEKNKQNFQVYKKVNKVLISTDKENIVNDLKFFINNPQNKILDYNYKFILRTRYKRSYWISKDKKIRATIDKDINVSSVNRIKHFFNLNETILEFKFSQNNENFFRNFFFTNNFNFRSKKFSKYIQSFNLLEESGLII